MLDPAIAMSLVLAFAALFAGAAVNKLRNGAQFAASFESYELLPKSARQAAARALPFAELAVAVGLFAAPTRRVAVLAGSCLLLIYATAIAINLRRGRRDLDCGCGGPREQRLIAPWMVWRNCLLAALLAPLALRPAARALQTVDLVTVAGSVTTAVLLYMGLDKLLGEVALRGAALRAVPGAASK